MFPVSASHRQRLPARSRTRGCARQLVHICCSGRFDVWALVSATCLVYHHLGFRGVGKVMFGHFDNSDEPLRQFSTYPLKRKASLLRRLRGRLRGRRLALYANGTPHFRFEIADAKFVYTYIRKNGCSAIKHFLSAQYSLGLDSQENASYFSNKFGISFESEGRDATVILIVRDPCERACSLFRNKFIQRSGAADIAKNYFENTQQDPQEATFSDFVRRYLRMYLSYNNFRRLDPHAVPQASQLWPIRYHKVFFLQDLRQAAASLFGSDLASWHFRAKYNNSSMKFHDEQCNDVPAWELRHHYHCTGRLPSDKSLLDDRIEDQVKEIYAVDYELISRSGLSQPAAAARIARSS